MKKKELTDLVQRLLCTVANNVEAMGILQRRVDEMSSKLHTVDVLAKNITTDIRIIHDGNIACATNLLKRLDVLENAVPDCGTKVTPPTVVIPDKDVVLNVLCGDGICKEDLLRQINTAVPANAFIHSVAIKYVMQENTYVKPTEQPKTYSQPPHPSGTAPSKTSVQDDDDADICDACDIGGMFCDRCSSPHETSDSEQ